MRQCLPRADYTPGPDCRGVWGGRGRSQRIKPDGEGGVDTSVPGVAQGCPVLSSQQNSSIRACG